MPNLPLHESFTHPNLDPRLRWHCPPSKWIVRPGEHLLHVEADAPTDFWQRTHYGFQADNGHFLSAEFEGDFVLTTAVRSRPVNQYDQAGLMVRVSSACWLKCSLEFEPDGPSHLGAVVTNHGYSDWSMQPVVSPAPCTHFRVRREADDCLVDISPDGATWQAIRVAHLHDAGGRSVACGLYACSPKGPGFTADFLHLTLTGGRVHSVDH